MTTPAPNAANTREDTTMPDIEKGLRAVEAALAATPDEIEALAAQLRQLDDGDDLAACLRDRAERMPDVCPETVTRTVRATGEEMRIPCLMCREAAARFEVAADLIAMPWHKTRKES